MKKYSNHRKPKGTSSCDIEISVDEWQEILTNPHNNRELSWGFVGFLSWTRTKATWTCFEFEVFFWNAKMLNGIMLGYQIRRKCSQNAWPFPCFRYQRKELNVAMNPSVDLVEEYEWTLKKRTCSGHRAVSVGTHVYGSHFIWDGW